MRHLPKSRGGWALVVVALLLGYHFRAQLLSWLQSVAGPLLTIVPAASVNVSPAGMPRGIGGFDPAYNATFGGGVNLAQIRGPAITGLPHGSVKCVWIGGGPLGGGTSSCGEIALQQGWHPPLQE